MTNLIEKKFYDTKDEAIAKLDVYFAMNRISEEEYATLALLAEEVYPQGCIIIMGYVLTFLLAVWQGCFLHA